MAKHIDPIARVLEHYRAIPVELRPAANYLLLKEIRGEHLEVPPQKRGRPQGSRNIQRQAPLIEGKNAAAAEGL